MGWRVFERMEPGIRLGVWWNVALLAGSVAALPFDTRSILGLNPWIKPIKFEISVIVFLVTMGLLLEVLRQNGGRARTLAVLGWGFGVAMILENTIIAMQSARGVPSHMNYSTAFNGVAFGTMGIFVAFNTALLAWMLWIFCTRRMVRPLAELWGIRLGLGMILAGSVEGFVIVMHGAHTVGAPDGGAGLPFLNWSTLHGDLRVAHFFALHALQAMWLVGWLLSRTSLPARRASWMTVGVAILYACAVWLLFASALAGNPLFATG